MIRALETSFPYEARWSAPSSGMFVWVDLPSKLYDPVRGHALYHEYMDQLEYADSLGYDGIGVNEHHQNGYGLMPSPNIIAATLARFASG